MRPLKTDLSIYKKFNFKYPPVGISYELKKPEGVGQLDKDLALCEMLKEAQKSEKPFYFTKENEACFGKFLLGMEETPAFAESGLMGIKLGVFRDASVNRRLYTYMPHQPHKTINYVVMAPLDKINFEPDLLMIMATASQGEIILRAMSYSSGELWAPRTTPVAGCAWLFLYPYHSGKVNYTITGLAFGMKSKEVFPEGWMLISIPYDWIPVITENLNEMEWELPAYKMGREKFLKREKEIMMEIAQECQNP